MYISWVKSYLILFYAAFLGSCIQHKTSGNKIVSASIHKKNVANKANPTDSTIYAGNPVVTQLPFGINPASKKLAISGRFYSKLVYRDIGKLLDSGWTKSAINSIKIYKLPPIKKATYFGLSYIDTNKCADGQPFGNFIKLTKYRYKLPDINGYQCYYWCDYNLNYDHFGYSESVKNNCGACLMNMFYGYFILYSPQSQDAKILTVYFDTYLDGSDHRRYFYIDKKHNIYLSDFSQEADDGDGSKPSPISIDFKYNITINKNGDLNIKKIKF